MTGLRKTKRGSPAFGESRKERQIKCPLTKWATLDDARLSLFTFWHVLLVKSCQVIKLRSKGERREKENTSFLSVTLPLTLVLALALALALSLCLTCH